MIIAPPKPPWSIPSTVQIHIMLPRHREGAASVQLPGLMAYLGTLVEV